MARVVGTMSRNRYNDRNLNLFKYTEEVGMMARG